MATLKTVGVRELKNRLSEYLREVRLGTTVLVTDRGTVVAELREPGTRLPDSTQPDLLDSWIEQGRVRAPLCAKRPVEPIRSRDAIHLATVLEFLRAADGIEVLSFDARVSGNIEPLGLRNAAPETR